jgi:hypothetical protein
MNKFVLIFVLLCSAVFSSAQEIFCTVQVITHPQVQVLGNDAKLYKSMESSISEFINNRKWTQDKFQPTERIEMKMFITINQKSGTEDFSATCQIQSSRPVFGSGYSTVLINEMDEDWVFKYVEFQAMEFQENNHTSNLTSLLAFYAYMTLGMDYDSFSKEGGTYFFNKAQLVVNAAQSAKEPGWSAFETKGNRNRYWFIDNVLSEPFRPLREVYYLYHRQALDIMATDIVKGRAQITKCLDMVQKVFRQNPNTKFLKVFFNAKADELVGVYSKAPAAEKKKIVDLLEQIDIANYKKYQAILN